MNLMMGAAMAVIMLNFMKSMYTDRKKSRIIHAVSFAVLPFRSRWCRVQELARSISESQRYEIDEMSWLVKDIRQNGIVTTPAEADRRRYPIPRH